MKNGAICMFLLYVKPCPEIAAYQSEPIGYFRQAADPGTFGVENRKLHHDYSLLTLRI